MHMHVIYMTLSAYVHMQIFTSALYLDYRIKGLECSEYISKIRSV